MKRLPVIHKTKLDKTLTYFVGPHELSGLISTNTRLSDVALNFSDDPSQFKSNYDRFVKKEGKLVVLSARYNPPVADSADEMGRPAPYVVTVYAMARAIREDLIEQFEKRFYAELIAWLNEPRDRVWLQSPHKLLFLLDIDSEKLELATDTDFDKYKRHAKPQKHRSVGRNSRR